MSADLQQALGEALRDRYEVTGEIGRGGMSVVFSATDRRHGRPVAIKVLRSELAGSVGVDRFLREIQIEARLQHPNILPLLDSGRMGEVPYCVLPLVTGPSLRDRLQREGQLPIDEALRIVTEVAGALAHAHRSGVVHRDVKPENILLTDGRAVLADFGIARAISSAATDRFTSEGIVVGTPAYMSPEQAGGASNLDGRSDLYSLGVILFEMLAGEPPFAGRNADAIVAKHRFEAPPSITTLRRTVPEPVALALARVLSKSPADRFPDANALADALHAPVASRSIWRSTTVRASAGVGSAIVLAAVWTFWPTPALGENAIAVFPVRDPQGGAGAALMSDQVAYAIELALDHARPLRWEHGWDWLSPEDRKDPVRVDARLQGRLARRHRVRFFIEGQITRTDTSTAVTLKLFDAKNDSLVAMESAAATAGADIASLGLRATNQLLVRWLAPERSREVQPLLAMSPAALALQLQGEREYRAARFARALDLFERAFSQDSFAYAAVKAAQAASWLNLLERAEGHANRAVLRSATLPAQYRPFALGLQAYLTGRADSAVRMLRAALAVAPDWDEAHMALGEVYYHLLPSFTRLDSMAMAQFAQSSVSDQAFTPPLTHLAEAAAREGNVTALNRYIDRLQASGADRSWILMLVLMRDCLAGQDASRWSVAAREDATAVLSAVKSLGVTVAQPECSDAGARALLGIDSLEAGHRWAALLATVGQHMAQGRSPEALRALDSARTAGTSNVLYVYVLGAVAGLPFGERADEVVRFARNAYGSSYERANPALPDSRGASALWIVAVWHRIRGQRDMVEGISARLAGAADTAPDNRRLVQISRAVAGHAALARADTAAAIQVFEALVSNARRDSLTFDHFEPLAIERLTLAELLFARKQFQPALEVASAFDHPEPVSFLAFLPRSLRIRAEAAESLREPQLATRFRNRLSQLNRAGGPGPR